MHRYEKMIDRGQDANENSQQLNLLFLHNNFDVKMTEGCADLTSLLRNRWSRKEGR